MMPANVLGSVPIKAWILSLVVLATARLLFSQYKKGCAKNIGPFLASSTDLWRVFRAYIHMNRPPMLDVHQQYGDIVRVGPNTVSLRRSEAIKYTYGPNEAWNKVCARCEAYQGY